MGRFARIAGSLQTINMAKIELAVDAKPHLNTSFNALCVSAAITNYWGAVNAGAFAKTKNARDRAGVLKNQSYLST